MSLAEARASISFACSLTVEREGNNLEGFKDVYLKMAQDKDLFPKVAQDKARIWP
jgi:hypothetical protein